MENQEKITVKGREFTIESERSHGRTARVSISGSLIRIRIPWQMRRSEAEKTFLEFRQWALRRLEKLELSELDPKPKYLDFSEGQEVRVMGRRFTIRIIEGRSRSSARVKDGIITIRLAEKTSQQERKREIHGFVRRAISRSVMDDFTRHVQSLNDAHFNFQFSNVAIREQSSRWGSCSRASKRISINFRILFALDDIRDYVIIHELAHLKHPNHSERFWNLVSTVFPDYKEKRRWLNKNGKTLGVIQKPAAIDQLGATLLPQLRY